ncbi:glycosyltransferase family 4 protein [Tumidithrix elongata RA019]|uniref:Glycosyltransferase family 4 protein n=1 Tax=Tumidithrix elongata BACA0141 TaxID=2716417 RepID=A0AAW9PQI5_9CYAN|nr:glycosyltransferase family 4 protein [Tumidithrix elongata RA019]
MQILVLAWEFPPRIIGGISRHVAELYPEVVKLGHHIHLVTVEVTGEKGHEVVDGIEVYRVPVRDGGDFFEWVANMNSSMLDRASQLINDRTQPFDAIHAHDWLVGDAAIALSQNFRLPLLATIHATEYGRCNGIHSDSQNYVHHKEISLAKSAARVIVCTKYMQGEVERALGCSTDKTDIVNNGLSLERMQRSHSDDFDPEALHLKYAQPDEAIVYYVGRITYEKGIYILLNAVPKILAAMSDKVKFVIIGTGDAYSILLQRQAWDLGIHHKVTFTGFMSDRDLSMLQTIASCAVFPSLYEPFGIVALESFAAGVPVVVSDTGGLPEVVENGVTGIVTHVNDSDSLAAGILEVLQNPDRAEKLVKNAQKELRDRFSWQKLAIETEAVYTRVISESKLAKE